VAELQVLLGRFMGPEEAGRELERYAGERGVALTPGAQADADLVHHVETLLAGSVGSASARVMVASVVEEEPFGLEEVMEILDEASHVRAHSRELERKSRELEAATAELRAANLRLQELDRLKDDFVSHVTHELRTPLTSIRAFSEILLDNSDIEPAERERFLRLIVEESERLTRLINQVLDLSKLESGRAEWQIEDVDVRAVLDDAVATARAMGDRQVELVVRADGELPPVSADRDRVKQVLLNLLSNAAKFCDLRHGRIEVRLAGLGDEVRVDVSDNGPGLMPDERERVFEKFRQAGETLTGKPKGTGLGLPISREIVTRLGGRMWVESQPGDGATFSFTLPATRGDGRPPSGEPVRREESAR
jgi:signal transduction histidine kinase